MVIDVIYENDHYLWQMWSDGDVSEKRFSYIVTDGEALYLANGVDWENQMRFGGNVVIPLLIPEGVTPEMVQAVEEQSAARLESNRFSLHLYERFDRIAGVVAKQENIGEKAQCLIF